MAASTDYEIVLPRRVLAQPRPPVRGAGDCAACVFGGILGWSNVDEVYERAGDVANRFDQRSALYGLRSEGHVESFVTAMPFWIPVSFAIGTPWGMTSWSMRQEWFDYVRLGIESGHYAIASVIFDQGGPVQPGKDRTLFGFTDHAVMICGVRSRWEDRSGVGKGRSNVTEVLVSCSAKSSPDLEWVEASDFLALRGGYNVVLVRPATIG